MADAAGLSWALALGVEVTVGGAKQGASVARLPISVKARSRLSKAARLEAMAALRPDLVACVLRPWAPADGDQGEYELRLAESQLGQLPAAQASAARRRWAVLVLDRD